MNTDALILKRVQDDLLAKLLSEPELQHVTVVEHTKLLTGSETQVAAVWMQSRNDKLGTAIVVAAPWFENEAAATAMTKVLLVMPLWVICHPDTALATAAGSGVSAEAAVLTARRLLRGWAVEGVGSFFTEGRSFEQFQPPANLDVVGYQLLLKCTLLQADCARVAVPTFSQSGSTVTLACVTASSTIYYTLDGSFPGPGNSAALTYASPFTVTSGQTVRAAAYHATLSGSPVISRSTN